MRQYIATFHTHLAALMTCRNLNGKGVKAAMMPVPRKLSASCGTCVRFTRPFDPAALSDDDLEAVYAVEAGGYRLLFENEEA